MASLRGARWRLWKEKCHDDSETKNWLTANTKPCPKCGKPVEKNGGCNLVMCMCRQVRTHSRGHRHGGFNRLGVGVARPSHADLSVGSLGNFAARCRKIQHHLRNWVNARY